MLLSLIENNELTGSIPPELENLEELDSLLVGESNQTCSCLEEQNRLQSSFLHLLMLMLMLMLMSL